MYRFFVDKNECSRHRIFEGVDVFTTHGEALMLSLVEMEPGAIVEEHSHPHEQMGLMLEGHATFTIGGETRSVGPGMMWSIPGGVRHRIEAGVEPVRALDVFHPIREEYK